MQEQIQEICETKIIKPLLEWLCTSNLQSFEQTGKAVQIAVKDKLIRQAKYITWRMHKLKVKVIKLSRII